MAKNLKISPRDLMILKILYRLPFAFDYQIAILVGEPVKYIRGRLNQLVSAGLVERKKLFSDEPVLNYLTAEGCRVIDFEIKKKRVPKIGRFEHDKGVISAYIWMAIKGVPFGNIISEKAMNSAIELKKVDDKWYRLGKDIHLPDGYLINGSSFCAIEYERTKKNRTSTKQMIQNVFENSRRFNRQYWFVSLPSIVDELRKTRAYKQKELVIIDMKRVYQDIDNYLFTLPEQLSDKSGIAPKILFTELKVAIPVAKIPLLEASSSFTSPQMAQSKPLFEE